MKKLVVVVFSALIMTLFIAFNYLLWDRENRITVDADKKASIDALSRQIRNLDEENKQLRVKVLEQDDNVKSLQTKYSQVERDRNRTKELLQQREDIIHVLKSQIDLKPIEAVIRKWVESIDKGQYDIAYELQFKQSAGQDKTEFINNYKSSVKSMKIVTVALADNPIPNEKKGQIVFKVSFEVKLNGNGGKSLLVEGVNERFFSMGFDKEKNNWMIADIYIYQ